MFLGKRRHGEPFIGQERLRDQKQVKHIPLKWKQDDANWVGNQQVDVVSHSLLNKNAQVYIRSQMFEQILPKAHLPEKSKLDLLPDLLHLQGPGALLERGKGLELPP